MRDVHPLVQQRLLAGVQLGHVAQLLPHELRAELDDAAAQHHQQKHAEHQQRRRAEVLAERNLTLARGPPAGDAVSLQMIFHRPIRPLES